MSRFQFTTFILAVVIFCIQTIKLNAQIAGVGVDVPNPLQKLDVNGAIRIRSTATGLPGSLRWTGTYFQFHDNTGWVTLTANTDDQVFDQVQLSGNNLELSIENDGQATHIIDLSGFLDNTDEQDLSLSGNTLSLTGDATTVDLSGYVNTDDQALSLSSNTLTLEDGGTVDLSSYLDNTDDQALSISGSNLTLEDGGTVDLTAFLDNTDDQMLSLSGTTLSLEDGGSVNLDPLRRLLVDADGDTRIQVEETTDEDKIRFDTQGAERMIIDQSGNIGIGTATPDRLLNLESSSGAQLLFTRDDNATTDGELMGEILFDNNDDTAPSSVDAAVVIRASASGAQGNSNKGGYLSFHTKDNGAGSASAIERMRLTANGKVGIGTSFPNAQLEVVKAQDDLLRLWRADNSNADVNFLFAANRNGGTQLDIGQVTAIYDNVSPGSENASMSFSTMNAGTLAEKVRITNNGNVGVGTTAPVEKLHVNNGNIAINHTYKYRFSGSDSNWELGYESGGPSSSFFGFNAAVLQTVYGDDPNYGYIIENTQGNSVFEIEGQTGKAYLAGNVGVGVNPEAKMHVNGNTSGALQDVLKLDNAPGTAGTETGLVFETGADRVARISAAHEAGDRGPLKFWTASSADNLAERMRITQDGVVRVNNLSGTGTRFVVTDANGNLSAGSSTSSGIVTGSGVPNALARWTPDGATLGTGITYDNGVKVGIGIPSPSYNLHVYGTSNPIFGVSDDGGAAGFIQPVGNSEVQFGTLGAFDMQFYVNGAYRASIVAASGNFGIATTAPVEKLHVSGGNVAINNMYKYRFSGSDSNWELGYESGNPSSSFFGFNAAVLQTVYGGDPNYGYIIENTQGNSIFEIEGQTGKAYLRGSVGVGVAPEAKMHVNGSTSGSIQDVLKLDNAPGTAGTETGLVFETGADRVARISAANEGGDRGPLKFWTASSVDNLTERMRITKDGQVGIGTTNPLYALDVTRPGTGGAHMRLNTGGNMNPFLDYAVQNVLKYSLAVEKDDDSFYASNASGAIQLRLLQNGNLGLGINNPVQKLDVQGTGRFTGLNGTGNRPVYANTSGDLVTTAGGANVPSSGYSLMDGTVWGTNEGTVRVVISGNTLYVRAYNEGGGLQNTHTIANVHNAKVLVTITNDDDGNSCGQVSRVLSFSRTNGQAEQSQSSDMGCPAADGHNQTIIIFYNPS